MSPPQWESRSASEHDRHHLASLNAEVDVICKTLAKTRPTAVNLFWGIAQVRDRYNQLAAANTPIPEIKAAVVALAQRLYDEDIANLRKLGAFGAALLPQEGTVLTHCNAGALATCGYGTALGVIRAAIERGQKIDVFADETRPFNSGRAPHRLGAPQGQHPHHAHLRQHGRLTSCAKGRIQAVIVGADRIAANGDTANKIGTYSVAVLAKEHGIPFYVAAPFNTIDLATATATSSPSSSAPPARSPTSNGDQMTPNGVGIQNPPSTSPRPNTSPPSSPSAASCAPHSTESIQQMVTNPTPNSSQPHKSAVPARRIHGAHQCIPG